MKPSPQSLQADAPSLLEYLPSGHALQNWLRSAAAEVPLLQLVAAVEPAKQKVPAGQAVQYSLLCAPVWLPNVPASHGSAALDPTKQYEPSEHGKV